MKLNFTSGFSSVFRGISLVSEHKLWGFTIIPSIICLVVIILSWMGFDAAMDALVDTMGSQSGILATLITIGRWFLQTVFIVFFLIYIFPIVVRLVMPPFLSILSEKMEVALTGGPLPEPPIGFWAQIMSGLKIAVKLTALETIILILVSGIPFIGQVVVFLVGSYFLGSGFFDLVLERKLASTSERERWFKDHKGVLTGQGAAVRLLGIIPFFGSLAGMIGATAGAVELYLVDTDVIPGKSTQ